MSKSKDSVLSLIPTPMLISALHGICPTHLSKLLSVEQKASIWKEYMIENYAGLNSVTQPLAAKQTEQKLSSGVNPTVIRRVVSECGHKAITIAARLNYTTHEIDFAVADSGADKQYDRKVGTKLALERLNAGPQGPMRGLIRTDFAIFREFTLVEVIGKAFGIEDPTYETLHAKVCRPGTVNHMSHTTQRKN